MADVTPIHKKLPTVSKTNYRPVSILAVVSKVFEGFIDEQTNEYIEIYLSRYLCGYRKGYSPQNAMLYMIPLRAYGFGITSLEILFDRWQRTKINSAFSTLSELVCGMAQGGKLGPKFFNIYLNDMFYEFVNTNVCNIADDTTPFVCDLKLENVVKKLESDISAVIYWFSANYMILNESKCHFLISTPSECEEQLSIKVGGQAIWESMSKVL